MKNIDPLLWPHIAPGGHNLKKKPFIFTLSGSFSGPVALEKIFPYIIICKTLIPYWGPIVPPGVMILTNLNLLYIRNIPYKFQLSWSCGS